MTTIETAGQSATATVCEHAALFGATPGRDEFDNRDIWDAEDTTDAVCEAFRILIEGVAPDGVQLADERESVLWGFVNMLDAQTQRLDRAADKRMPALRDPQREQDGTEIKSLERFLDHEEEKCEEFRGQLTAYRNLYAFLSPIIPYQDTDLERLYAYARNLLAKLPPPGNGPINASHLIPFPGWFPSRVIGPVFLLLPGVRSRIGSGSDFLPRVSVYRARVVVSMDGSLPARRSG